MGMHQNKIKHPGLIALIVCAMSSGSAFGVVPSNTENSGPDQSVSAPVFEDTSFTLGKGNGGGGGNHNGGGGGGGGNHNGGGGGGGMKPPGGGGGGNHNGGGGGGGMKPPGGGGGGNHNGGGGGGGMKPPGGGGGNHNGGGGNNAGKPGKNPGGNQGNHNGGGNNAGKPGKNPGGNQGNHNGGGNNAGKPGKNPGGNQGNHNGGGNNAGKPGKNPGGNQGNNNNPGKPGKNPQKHLKHDGNNVPPVHVANIKKSEQKVHDKMMKQKNVKVVVQKNTTIYNQNYKNVVVKKVKVFERNRHEHRKHYSQNWGPRYHFWGYHWYSPVIVNISTEFWNPCFNYFYTDSNSWNDDYYSSWYGDTYASYPALRRPFRRPWVFYPNVAFRDLTYGVSVWEAPRQITFREAMDNLTENLEQQLSERYGTNIELSSSSVVIDHYQLIDSAVLVDGIVSVGDDSYPYKAYLSFTDPNQDIVFIPSSNDGDPNQYDVDRLDQLNSRFVNDGGDLDDPQD